MNETNERADFLIGPAVTLNVNELRDKDFCSFSKMCQGRAAASEGQDSHYGQGDVSPVCSITEKLLLLNQEGRASASLTGIGQFFLKS